MWTFRKVRSPSMLYSGKGDALPKAAGHFILVGLCGERCQCVGRRRRACQELSWGLLVKSREDLD